MNYCPNCGKEIKGDGVFCPYCGKKLSEEATRVEVIDSVDDLIRTITKVFMIIGCVSSGFAIFPLLWTIPMTKHYFHSKKVGLGFAICSLIFVNLIAGILLIVQSDEVKND